MVNIERYLDSPDCDMDSELEDFYMLIESSDEEDARMEDTYISAAAAVYFKEKTKPKKRGGSTEGRVVIRRDRQRAETALNLNYFDADPTYPPEIFRRRFRMRRELFNRIVEGVEKQDSYFEQRQDARKVWGFTARQKCTAAIRQLAYGASPDSYDEYLQMAESTGMESLKRFCKAVIDYFGKEYLRNPNADDLKTILKVNEERGFRGMLGSIDCMHWEWKNCPTSWHGQYTGKEKYPTIILEAVATHDLWIWHCFFGLPGALNDINVLDRSFVFDNFLTGEAPKVSYVLNGHQYDMGYYLGDGIYPKYANLVKTIPNPTTLGEKVYFYLLLNVDKACNEPYSTCRTFLRLKKR